MGVIESVKGIAKRLTGEVPISVLEKRGLIVGCNLNRQQGSYIDPTHCFLIEIGNNVTLSIRVTLMAHDASTKKILGYTKIGKIIIGDNVFIGANSTVLPNVTIGDNVVIGANSVVTKDIPSGSVAVGNPARVICTIEEYKDKNARLMAKRKLFGKEYRFSRSLSATQKKEIKEAVKAGIAFID